MLEMREMNHKQFYVKQVEKFDIILVSPVQ